MTLIHLLFSSGLIAAVHAICTANCMSKRAPLSVAAEIIMMFGFAIGCIASCWNGDTWAAARFLLVAIVAKTVSVVDMVIRGYELKFALVTCATYQYHDRRSTDRVDDRNSPP